jgi:hypothetical protein
MSLISPRPVYGYDQRRSSSTNKQIFTLPQIEHPSKRFDPNQKNALDIRGRSRDGDGNGKLIRNEVSTIETPRTRRRSSSLKYHSKSSKHSQHLDDIQENPDPHQLRLPIFGKYILFFILKIQSK